MEVVSNNQYHYEVEATYAEVLPAGENGAPIEVEKTATVKVRKLQRKNRDHCKLAMAITTATDAEAVAAVAERFVACAVESAGQEKLKKALAEDMFACFNLYNSKAVQEDVDSFLLKLDFVRAAVDAAQAE